MACGDQNYWQSNGGFGPSVTTTTTTGTTDTLSVKANCWPPSGWWFYPPYYQPCYLPCFPSDETEKLREEISKLREEVEALRKAIQGERRTRGKK